MIIMVWGVGRVEVIEEGERTEVQRETEQRSIVSVQHAVGESISLPLGDCKGVPAADSAVETGVAVFF